MEYNSFMEALKGKQHKIDKNKNGEVDAQDFKLLRKEESEELGEEERKGTPVPAKEFAKGVLKDLKKVNVKESEESLDEIHRMKTKFNRLDPVSAKSVARQKLSNLIKSGHGKGALIANKMRTLNMGDEIDQEDLDTLYEVLSKDAEAGDWIHDFVHSTNPKFEGKTKKERIKMALGAYYDTQKKKDGVTEGYQSYSGRSHGNPYGGGGFGRREREDDEYHNEPEHKPVVDRRSKPQPYKPTKFTPSKGGSSAVVGRTPSNEIRKEEAEQIDEISKSTLGSYVKKASFDSAISKKIATDFQHRAKKARSQDMKDANTSISNDYNNKSWKRQDNVNKAVDRLTKEEIEISEEQGHHYQVTYYDKDGKAGDSSKRFADKDKADAHANKGNSIDKVGGSYKVHKVDTPITEGRNEGDVPFDKPYKTVTTPVVKDKSGAAHTPMSRARNLARMALKKMQDNKVNEAAYAGLEKEDKPGKVKTAIVKQHPNGVEGETVEGWKDAKKAVKEDVQKADIPAYLRKAKGEKPLELKDLKRKDTISDPENLARNRGVKESFDDEGNVTSNQITYKEFAMMLEYETVNGKYVHKGTYGGSYSDPEGADDADDKKPKQQPAEKRGRGRPAGAKSGARKITGTSKLFK